MSGCALGEEVNRVSEDTMTDRGNQLSQHSISEFFHGEVSRTAEELGNRCPADTQIYLAELLVRFSKAESLFIRWEGQLETEPLAFILKRALESDEDGRIRSLKQLGDMALFTSGFFAERVERRGMDVDYYIDMGGMAYANVATLAAHRPQAMGYRELYEKLAQHFADLVDVLWEVADRSRTRTTEGLLKLYRKWEETRSARLARKLTRNGFILGPDGRPCEC